MEIIYPEPKIKRTVEKKESKILKIIQKLISPESSHNELKDVYQDEYDKTYQKEREEFLKKKAQQDAKAAAKKGSLQDNLKKFLTGGV